MFKQKQSFVKKLRDLGKREADFSDVEDFFAEKTEKNNPSLMKKHIPIPANPSEKDTSHAEGWLQETAYDGQLAVDVFETPTSIVVQSTVAGVRPDDIDIAFYNDTLTIRGLRRKKVHVAEEHYLYQECYWGGFSRSIILPVDVHADAIEAELENGILTITVPKSSQPTSRVIEVKEVFEDS